MPIPQPGGWRGLWTLPRARLWLIACVIAAYLPALGMPARGWLDFSAFYAAGHFAFTAQVDQLLPIAQYQAAHDLPPTPFVYPAWVALPYVPLAALPYDLAGALHVALAFWPRSSPRPCSGRGSSPSRGPGPYWAPLPGRPGGRGRVRPEHVVALLLVVGVAAALQAGRPVLAGILGGVLLYKPQLDVPVVLTLAWRGLMRAVAAAALVVIAQYLLVPAAGGDWGLARDLVGLPADVQPARPGRQRLAGRLVARAAGSPRAR